MPWKTWKRKKQSSFWELSFKIALTLQLATFNSSWKSLWSHRGSSDYFLLIETFEHSAYWNTCESCPFLVSHKCWETESFNREKKSAFCNKFLMSNVFYLWKMTYFCLVWQFLQIMIMLEMLLDDTFLSIKVRWNYSRRNINTFIST